MPYFSVVALFPNSFYANWIQISFSHWWNRSTHIKFNQWITLEMCVIRKIRVLLRWKLQPIKCLSEKVTPSDAVLWLKRWRYFISFFSISSSFYFVRAIILMVLLYFKFFTCLQLSSQIVFIFGFFKRSWTTNLNANRRREWYVK